MTQLGYNSSRPKDALNAWLSFGRPRSDVGAAKRQRCQTGEGMGLKYNFKQLFIYFFGKRAVFLYATTLSPLPTLFFDKGKQGCLRYQGVILNSSGACLGSWLRCVCSATVLCLPHSEMSGCLISIPRSRGAGGGSQDMLVP